MREAQTHLQGDGRFVYVAGNWYQMPFVAGLFETMVQVRTIHHAADVPALFTELGRIARPGGRYVLEFANKQNIKAILRYGLRRQDWSPFAPEPVEFIELNFDFHPRWMRQQLQAAGFRPRRTRTISHYRIALLKRIVPTGVLVAMDRLAQPTGNWWQFSPSVVVQSEHPSAGPAAPPGAFFACPACQTPFGDPVDGLLVCASCGRRWRVEDGLYDFKEPV